MADLNVMMREQAVLGLQSQLDAAVTNGDTVAARKISDDLAKLAVSTAPKAPAYGDADIFAELDKQPWYGVDPKKSAKAVEFGKTMKHSRFPTAAAFAEALVKAVEEEFKPPTQAVSEDDDGAVQDDAGAAEDDDAGKAAAAKPKPRKTDGPGEADALGRAAAGRRTGPWAKITDAPAEVQKEIKRTTDKYVSANAPKEQREKFITKALESHYAVFQRNKGKKP